MSSVGYTQGDKALIEKAKGESLKFVGLAGRGATAPGAVVIREMGGLHPFAAHFFNSQDGGYYFGDYCMTQEEAERAFNDKLRRYDPYGELQRSFKA